MKKESYYQWVKASEELPPNDNKLYKCIDFETGAPINRTGATINAFPENTEEWQKPITGYLLTEEQMKEAVPLTQSVTESQEDMWKDVTVMIEMGAIEDAKSHFTLIRK